MERTEGHTMIHTKPNALDTVYKAVLIHYDPEGKFILSGKAYPSPYWVAMLGTFPTLAMAQRAIDQDPLVAGMLARRKA
jgi:hypothetical protein